MKSDLLAVDFTARAGMLVTGVPPNDDRERDLRDDRKLK